MVEPQVVYTLVILSASNSCVPEQVPLLYIGQGTLKVLDGDDCQAPSTVIWTPVRGVNLYGIFH